MSFTIIKLLVKVALINCSELILDNLVEELVKSIY